MGDGFRKCNRSRGVSQICIYGYVGALTPWFRTIRAGMGPLFIAQTHLILGPLGCQSLVI